MSSLNNEIDMQKVFAECRSEMGVQQSKRDQIIAFYLTLCGIVCSVAFLNEFNEEYRHFIFLSLAAIGFLFTAIVLRYRLYKENYWLSSKVILSLYSTDKSNITEEKVKNSLYCIMCKQYRGLMKKHNGNLTMKTLYFYNVRSQCASAEKLMYTLMSLLSAGSLGLGVGIWANGLAIEVQLTMTISVSLISFLLYIFIYDILLTKHYYYIISANESNLEKAITKAYGKAWMINFFDETKK